MKEDKKNFQEKDQKPGFSDKEFIAYLEERFRILRLEEQKFREEVLMSRLKPERTPGFIKV